MAAPEPGWTLSHYRLVEKIGEGGMGVVWKAQDIILGRTVAIKVLPGEAALDETRRRMFLEEARLASTLSTAHIVQVYEFVREGDLDLIVMEHIDGEPLSRMLRGRPLAPEKVADIGTQVARALSKAHHKGLVHRDLKPSNIMVTGEGEAKVVDFGLATLFAREESTLGSRVADATTVPDQQQGAGGARVAGTLPYMSPEQVGGEKLDARSDVFSLGVVLYEMTTGTRPFGGANVVETVAEIRRCRPRPVHEMVPKVPLDLERILQKSLASRPADRYQTMDDLAVDLRHLGQELASGSAPSYDEISEALGPRRRHVGMVVMMGVVVTLLAVAVVLGALLRDRWRTEAPRSPEEGFETLAVLPLRNISGDPQEDYLVDGVTEELITHLAKIRSLRVISTTSVMAYKGTRKPVSEIGRELNVGSIVEGSVLRVGDTVRVTTQLIDVPTNRHVWAESYERPFRDILSLQSDVARTVARKIQVTMTAQDEARVTTTRSVDPEALEAYFRARHSAEKFSMEEEWRESLNHFRRAIDKDPTFASAHAGLSFSYYLGSSVFLPPGEAMPAARSAALRALEIDPSSAEASAALAIVESQYEWHWQDAEERFRIALDLNPSYAFARSLFAQFLGAVGRGEEALAEIEQARQLDPLSYYIHTVQMFILYMTGRSDQVVRLSEKVIAMEPDAPAAHAFVGMAYERLGRFPEAIAALARATQLGSVNENQALLAYVHARAGDPAKARGILGELEGLSAASYRPLYNMALVHLALAETETAFDLLARACEERNEWMTNIKSDPRFEPLRDSPRFAELVRCVGLPS